MKLWFHYYVGRLVSPDGDPYERVSTEGFIDLFDWLLENKVVDAVTVRVDNYKPTLMQYVRKSGVVVEFMGGPRGFDPQPGDVVWVRGGWKGSWMGWPQSVESRGIWLVYYDSNTGHWRWPYWHVMLRDIKYETELRQPGKRNPLQLWVHYPKPVSRLFAYRPGTPPEWDVMVNSSYIYDRKGQWVAYRALLEYERIYGQKLRVVVPGAIRYSGERTIEMLAEIEQHPNFELPGFLPRALIAEMLNVTRVYLATTCGGYGDRAGAEAGMCGCSLVIFHPGGSYNYHAPYVFDNPEVSLRVDHLLADPKRYDFAGLARAIHDWLQGADERRAKVAEWFRQRQSIETGSGPVLKKLFNFMRRHPVADRALLPALLEEMRP